MVEYVQASSHSSERLGKSACYNYIVRSTPTTANESSIRNTFEPYQIQTRSRTKISSLSELEMLEIVDALGLGLGTLVSMDIFIVLEGVEDPMSLQVVQNVVSQSGARMQSISKAIQNLTLLERCKSTLRRWQKFHEITKAYCYRLYL